MQKRKVAEDEEARRVARRAAADAKLDALRRADAQTAAAATQLGLQSDCTAAALRQQSRERAELVVQQDRELAQARTVYARVSTYFIEYHRLRSQP